MHFPERCKTLVYEQVHVREPVLRYTSNERLMYSVLRQIAVHEASTFTVQVRVCESVRKHV